MFSREGEERENLFIKRALFLGEREKKKVSVLSLRRRRGGRERSPSLKKKNRRATGGVVVREKRLYLLRDIGEEGNTSLSLLRSLKDIGGGGGSVANRESRKRYPRSRDASSSSKNTDKGKRRTIGRGKEKKWSSFSA